MPGRGIINQNRTGGAKCIVNIPSSHTKSKFKEQIILILMSVQVSQLYKSIVWVKSKVKQTSEKCANV